MKKLNLKMGGIKEMLSREQMKKVVGGDGYGYAPAVCKSSCYSNGDCANNPNNKTCSTIACTPGATDTTFYQACTL